MKWNVDLFEDMDRLKAYLKKLFRLMYLCEMLKKECGVPASDWKEIVDYCVGTMCVSPSSAHQKMAAY